MKRLLPIKVLPFYPCKKGNKCRSRVSNNFNMFEALDNLVLQDINIIFFSFHSYLSGFL